MKREKKQQPEARTVRIYWRDTKTGRTGQGDAMTQKEAEAFLYLLTGAGVPSPTKYWIGPA